MDYSKAAVTAQWQTRRRRREECGSVFEKFGHGHRGTRPVEPSDGVGRSRVTSGLIERKLTTRGTGRNWNTVLKIAETVLEHGRHRGCRSSRGAENNQYSRHQHPPGQA
jgi:hypothetical protein